MELLLMVGKYILWAACAFSLFVCVAAYVSNRVDIYRSKKADEKRFEENAFEAKLRSNRAIRIINDDIGYHGMRLSKVEELGKDAHKRIDDTRRHFGKDMESIISRSRTADMVLAKGLDQLIERVNALEDISLKKARKNAKSAKA